MTHSLAHLVTPTPSESQVLLKLLQTGAEVSHKGLRHPFSRAAWSHIIEPGDKVAVCLVEALGPNRALAHVVAGTDAKAVLDECAAQGIRADSLTVSTLRSAFRRWSPRVDRGATLAMLERAVAHRMQLLLPGAEYWPRQVDDLEEHRPLALWVRGDLQIVRRPSLSVVGARSCSAYGQHVTADIVEAAVQKELVVVSGGAYGIDGVAHRAALACGGDTVAVLAGGADQLYPREHTQLFHAIMKQGAIVAETPPGTAPTRWRFLQRNRLIAALSRATIVTEAGQRSGSINTAGHAAHLGRELAAVPGPITSAGSHGCFRIITEYGAHMYVGRSDLDTLLEPLTVGDAQEEPRELSVHRRTLDAMPLRGARSASTIARLSGLGYTESLESLIELELLGEVRRVGEGSASEVSWQLIARAR